MRCLAARAGGRGPQGLTGAMIRIDALWLCTQPQDMRAGADRLLAVVVNTVGEARAHHGYLFANARASRIKLLVHDGSGCGAPPGGCTPAASCGAVPQGAPQPRCNSAPSSSTPSRWAC